MNWRVSQALAVRTAAAGLFARHCAYRGRTLRHMRGTRRSVTSADGVRIGLLTAGSGPTLLLVHGGMGTISSWQRIWEPLAAHRCVTAMDRRGRGTSGDADIYSLSSEYADVAAVAAAMASEQGGPVDVVGHSIGATCVLGAAAGGAQFRRIVLYEPAGPQATQNNWPESPPWWPTARSAVLSHLSHRHHRPDPQGSRSAARCTRRAGCAAHRRRNPAPRSPRAGYRRLEWHRRPGPAASAAPGWHGQPALG